MLAGAVKDQEGNLSAEGSLALTPDVNPKLSSLTVGSGTLTPGFDPAQAEYALTLPAGTKELQITASAVDAAAKLTIGSEPAISGMEKKLTLPENGIIEVSVDLGGGIAAKTYRIHVSVAGGGEPTPSPSATATPTPSPSATATPTPSATATPVPTAGATATPVPTASATATPVPTASATATPVPTPSATATPAPTASATATPAPTASATATPVPTPSATATPVPTAGATATPTASAAPTANPNPTASPTSTPGGEPKDPLDVSDGAKISKKTTPDGKTMVYVDISADAISEALKDGRKAKELYFELKDRADGVILQIPAQGMLQMKNAEAKLLVKTVLMNVKINAAAALQGTALADGAKYRLVVVKTEATHPAAAGKPGTGIKLLSPPVMVHAETISNDLAAPVPVAAVKRALQGEFVSLSEKKELVDIFRYDAATLRWVLVKSTPNAAGTGLLFDISTMGPYAALTIMHRRFDDTAGHWAEQDIDWMVRRLLVEGTSETLFKPNDPITRAEFTAMLVRALNLPEGDNRTAAGFTDVGQSAWYSGAVQSAVSQGLVKGWDGKHFAPDKTITREEMAVMIGRAYPLFGAKVSSAADLGLLGQYSDNSRIHGWAKNAVALLLDEGIMKGITEGRFGPEGITTRAEAVAVLRRLLSKSEE
jgi:hypothetical protein